MSTTLRPKPLLTKMGKEGERDYRFPPSYVSFFFPLSFSHGRVILAYCFSVQSGNLNRKNDDSGNVGDDAWAHKWSLPTAGKRGERCCRRRDIGVDPGTPPHRSEPASSMAAAAASREWGVSFPILREK